MDDFQIKFNKLVSKSKQKRTIKECFYHDKAECQGKIKKAHSIQRNKRLSILEEEIKGNKVLYSFISFEVGEEQFIKKLVPIGKGEASTFYGFCDFHDSKLFAPIENFEFDDSDKHCFLHSYRSFAHTYHLKKEEFRGNAETDNLDSFGSEFKSVVIEGNKQAVKDMEEFKLLMDECIENELFDKLEYFSIVLPELYPIACSACISPRFTPKSKLINDLGDLNAKTSPIMLTVLPDFSQTIIILACFPNDKRSIALLDELELLNDYQIRRVISSFLVFSAENTFISPSLWNALGTKGQKALCKELSNSASFNVPNKFQFSEINFFSPQFAYDRLSK